MSKRIAVLLLAGSLACSTATLPPDAIVGDWSSPSASLTLSESAGIISYPCGSGAIFAGWQLAPDGAFEGIGEHRFGGGPEPIGGRQAHPASYSGRMRGKRLTLSVHLSDLNQLLGPFELTRGGAVVGPVCL